MESTTKGSDLISKKKKKKTSWFSWRRIRLNKNSAYKTVPLEASISDQAHYSKSRSKSTLHLNSQAPGTNHPPPPATPYYTPSQTRHGPNNVEDTRQQGRASPPQVKRQARRVSSSMQSQTTSKKHKNARRSYDSVVGMSVLAVTLLIMIFWGRLCAILCTSAWLYFIPRFKKSDNENDDGDPNTTMKSNGVDLDSEEYKKKVIMEGLLERNHRAAL
ncbi:uncharacterized protein At5g23160-like [Abrus precatorius]|uniref:Uncharacterized protein At5g23160-like n=1 Tax=Abrus precatorius TaxID=3816 RepID=A0A8B8M199_ABRPR|nr:uncharacterized protein At5g23160-like [Abrus precatorius]